MLRQNVSQRFAPNHRADLALLRDRAGRKTALDGINRGVRHDPFQAKVRLELADSYIRLRDAMPVNENVGAGKSGATAGKTVALPEIAFDFKVELLGKVSDQIDARAPDTKTVFQRAEPKTSFESGNIAAFGIHLEVTAQRQFVLRTAWHDIDWWR